MRYQTKIDFDKKLSKYVSQTCWTCGAYIRTKDKARLSLFMLDHWGQDDIKRCTPTFYGKLVNKYMMWRTRNI
jgi:hypothetical protein